MGRKNRSEVFVPTEIAIVHAICKVVRRYRLLGYDPNTQKNYDHRKIWIENELKRLACFFGIDVLAFSILSNHVHQVLRSRPDIVATWSDREVAMRWLLLCPSLLQGNKGTRKQLELAAKLAAEVENGDSVPGNVSHDISPAARPSVAADSSANAPAEIPPDTRAATPSAGTSAVLSGADAVASQGTLPFFTLEPSEAAINKIVNNIKDLSAIRIRLSDISWWMRLMCQRIAQWVNMEENEDGRFWGGRFKAIRLMDETAILACTAYVDLNVLRAALAETVDLGDFTSAQRRIQDLQARAAALEPSAGTAPFTAPFTATGPLEAITTAAEPPVSSETDKSQASGPALRIQKPLPLPIHQWLAPVELKEEDCSTTQPRRKGYLPITDKAYIELLDWTARLIVPGKPGATPLDTPPILERLNIKPEVWRKLTTSFDELFSQAAGRIETIDSQVTPTKRTYYVSREARELLTGELQSA